MLEGKVVQIKEYGAFVELEAGLDGLVHISEIANKRVENVFDELKVGETVNVKIMEIDPEKRRISLSIKATLPEEEAVEEEKETVADAVEDAVLDAKEAADEAAEAVKEKAKDVIDAVKEAVDDVKEDVKEAAEKVSDAVQAAKEEAEFEVEKAKEEE